LIYSQRYMFRAHTPIIRGSRCVHDLLSGSQDHHPSKNSVQKTICCNSTSKAPDDGSMYPKLVELRIHQ